LVEISIIITNKKPCTTYVNFPNKKKYNLFNENLQKEITGLLGSLFSNARKHYLQVEFINPTVISITNAYTADSLYPCNALPLIESRMKNLLHTIYPANKLSGLSLSPNVIYQTRTCSRNKKLP